MIPTKTTKEILDFENRLYKERHIDIDTERWVRVDDLKKEIKTTWFYGMPPESNKVLIEEIEERLFNKKAD